MKKNYVNPALVIYEHQFEDVIAASSDNINGNPGAGDIIDTTI